MQAFDLDLRKLSNRTVNHLKFEFDLSIFLFYTFSVAAFE